MPVTIRESLEAAIKPGFEKELEKNFLKDNVLLKRLSRITVSRTEYMKNGDVVEKPFPYLPVKIDAPKA